MNIENLKQCENRIIFETISGSWAYGTNIESSDVDIRGIFVLPKKDHLSLMPCAKEVGDDKQDIKYYELRKFFELAKDCNPNIVELLFMPEDCIKIKTPIMEKILANRNLFVSAKAYHTFSGYAYAQIHKAKGKNKFVNNPKSKERPVKEDFCWVIPGGEAIDKYGITLYKEHVFKVFAEAPCRPIPIKDTYLNLNHFHCARLEHTTNVYRLYYYGEKAKGIFRGDDMLVPESIPLEDEHEYFYGFLIYDKDIYDKELRDWNSYWEWINNRNDARWIDQEKGKLDYDQKNLLHCMRLLLSGKNILLKGEPIVRFEGEQLQYLKNIRAGNFVYEEIMNQVEKEMQELEVLKGVTKLAWGVDIHKIDELYLEIMEEIV